MKVSDAGIEFIKQREGFRPKPYDDVVGKQTIGYGHLIRKGESFTSITESEATKLLCADLISVEACIDEYCLVPLNQNQFDALASFAFNLGCYALESSTLLRLLNDGKYASAADEFPRWCRAGGREVPGLKARRLAEQTLFRTPCADSSDTA